MSVVYQPRMYLPNALASKHVTGLRFVHRTLKGVTTSTCFTCAGRTHCLPRMHWQEILTSIFLFCLHRQEILTSVFLFCYYYSFLTQNLLCSGQSLFWQSREQYLAVWHPAHTLMFSTHWWQRWHLHFDGDWAITVVGLSMRVQSMYISLTPSLHERRSHICTGIVTLYWAPCLTACRDSPCNSVTCMRGCGEKEGLAPQSIVSPRGFELAGALQMIHFLFSSCILSLRYLVSRLSALLLRGIAQPIQYQRNSISSGNV